MKYLVVIDLYAGSILSSVKKLRESEEYKDLSIILLTRLPQKYSYLEDADVAIEVLGCSFENEKEIKRLFEPFTDHIVAVICRGDKQIQFLRYALAYIPNNVLVASEGSLHAATDKGLMRQCFTDFTPEITPKFLRLDRTDATTIDKIENRLDYPVIVKPSNLVSSLLIQSCANRKELENALNNIFSKIHVVYASEERSAKIEVIVEEFLEGDFYSIDAYILNKDHVYFCPPVSYIPAKQLGIDDFFLYKRSVPTNLSKHAIHEANITCKKALSAVGLTYSTAHIELINTESGWKVIEVGPRVGRFRNTMYAKAYGLDHSLNDILIHLGKVPIIPTKLLRKTAAYSIYPKREGYLEQISGIDQLVGHPAISALKIFASKDDYCKHAKNGGKALAEFIVSSSDDGEFNYLTQLIERDIEASVR